MDLFIQMGHGNQSLALEHLECFGDGTLILSPMNISPNAIKDYANKAHKRNGKIMVDPQLYYPRKAKNGLEKYDYWPKRDITALEQGQFDEVISKLVDLNHEIKADALILPSTTAKKIDSLWDNVQRSIIESSQKYASDMIRMHTIALTSGILNDENQIEEIISYVEKWDVQGVYIVCEHPQNYYLVEQPLWVSNLMSLVAGIKRQRKKVVVGYASHQLLCLALAKCDAIASGNFLNLRWFQKEHFEMTDDNQTSRRAVWYYCPQALSEYKIPFLDIAQRMDLLNKMEPPDIMKNEYSEVLFNGSLPSSTEFKERDSFRHYLYCLRKQCQDSVRGTYQETLNAYLVRLETANQLLSGLSKRGIKGQNRDFSELIDVNRAAISAFDMAYGIPLLQEWNSLKL